LAPCTRRRQRSNARCSRNARSQAAARTRRLVRSSASFSPTTQSGTRRSRPPLQQLLQKLQLLDLVATVVRRTRRARRLAVRRAWTARGQAWRSGLLRRRPCDLQSQSHLSQSCGGGVRNNKIVARG
jgi:DNA invertase Pin-like site-specific DNA recombinase